MPGLKGNKKGKIADDKNQKSLLSFFSKDSNNVNVSKSAEIEVKIRQQVN
jgi:hypothetical protein